MYRLCCQILGPPFGDFRPGAMSREEFLALVRLTAKPALPSTVRQVFAPRATFSNVVLEFGRQENVERWDDWFCRSSRSADGAVVTGANAAVVFFNGDCPLVCLWHNDRLAVTHAGYRCLIGRMRRSGTCWRPLWIRLSHGECKPGSALELGRAVGSQATTRSRRFWTQAVM